MLDNSKLIMAGEDITRIPIFRKIFRAECGASARLTVGGFGAHDVFLNGKKVGDTVLAPGWQDYKARICAAEYTLDGLSEENTLIILLTPAWYAGRISRKPEDKQPRAIIAEISLDGNVIGTDESWEVSDSMISESDIYDGIVCDANVPEKWMPVELCGEDTAKFVPDTTVPTREFETVYPTKLIKTPNGETVLDFGVNLVGYPIITLNAKKGERVRFSFAEILDHNGNFYNENYRSALCRYDYTCRDGEQTFTPLGTFYGWRYLRIDELPDGIDPLGGAITAKVIHADMKPTGSIRTGDPLVNRFFDNVIRGQLGNYVSAPTDCPQRDERAGWTGDAQVFIKAAAYNFDVRDFIYNWLCDMVTEQRDGIVPDVIPHPMKWGYNPNPRAAWADAVTIVPWELYMTYGDKEALSLCFDAMKKHIEAIGRTTKEPYLFTGCDQYGDWLGLDAPEGSFKGSSDKDIIASAYYAHSCRLLIDTGRVLGQDVTEYEALHEKICTAFREKYESELKTQTECALALRFELVKDTEAVTRRLVDRIHAAGDKLETGFVGTPYILHALSSGGEYGLAYKLLLNTEFPSWLYPVTMGATTIWEHWDGIRPDGRLWSKSMNSYNHYAYGAVVDWIYSVAAGIVPALPGYERAIIEPHPDKRLETLDVSFESRSGRFEVSWYYEGDIPHYRITTPVGATLVIDGRTVEVGAGTYVF